LRSKVTFAGDDYSSAQFTVTDLWIDQATVPDLWNNSVLGDHLTSDTLAHDWIIVKDESFVTCET
jgi:hypothetical protein